jgi:DNA-binding transcriptional regulator YiaG
VTLKFRNLEVDPSDPVEQWGPEGLLAAGDRGEVEDWARIYAAVDRDPYGDVAQTLLEDVAGTASTRGVAEIMVRHVHEARAQAHSRDKGEIARQVRALVAASGMSSADFARRIGTSASRLSTYANGRVTPNAALMLRMERVSNAARDAQHS